MIVEGEDFLKIFNQALTFPKWLESIPEEYRVKTQRYYEKIYMIVVSEYKERIKIDSRYCVNILVVLDDSCWDCQFYIPVLARLSENIEKLNLKLLKTDDPLVKEYNLLETTNGGNKTPYVLFYSVDGYYIDKWVERPTIVYELYARLKRELGFSNKEFYKEYRKEFLKNQEMFYRAAAEELAMKICRANAIQGTSNRINKEFLVMQKTA